jgi:hypothetical protein
VTCGRRARHLLATLALFGGTTLASACGFEDPKGADAARGAVNWIYPDALHVTSAVWRAQLAGVIERAPAAKSLFAYQTATIRLTALGDRLSGEAATPGFSVLLIGPMLWSQYRAEHAGLTVIHHRERAGADDVVIVTDEHVVAALVAGRLTASAAAERGLLRFYGRPGEVQHLASIFAHKFDQNPAIAMVKPDKISGSDND